MTARTPDKRRQAFPGLLLAWLAPEGRLSPRALHLARIDLHLDDFTLGPAAWGSLRAALAAVAATLTHLDLLVEGALDVGAVLTPLEALRSATLQADTLQVGLACRGGGLARLRACRTRPPAPAAGHPCSGLVGPAAARAQTPPHSSALLRAAEPRGRADAPLGALQVLDTGRWSESLLALVSLKLRGYDQNCAPWPDSSQYEPFRFPNLTVLLLSDISLDLLGNRDLIGGLTKARTRVLRTSAVFPSHAAELSSLCPLQLVSLNLMDCTNASLGFSGPTTAFVTKLAVLKDLALPNCRLFEVGGHCLLSTHARCAQRHARCVQTCLAAAPKRVGAPLCSACPRRLIQHHPLLWRR